MAIEELKYFEYKDDIITLHVNANILATLLRTDYSKVRVEGAILIIRHLVMIGLEYWSYSLVEIDWRHNQLDGLMD